MKSGFSNQGIECKKRKDAKAFKEYTAIEDIPKFFRASFRERGYLLPAIVSFPRNYYLERLPRGRAGVRGSN